MDGDGITADHCAIARAALGMSVAELARVAGVPTAVVLALESGDVRPADSSRIATALADLGITFHGEPGGGQRMRVHTLDGIIETPVTLARR